MAGFARPTQVSAKFQKRKLKAIPAQDELEAEVGVLFAAKLMATSSEEQTQRAYEFIKESLEDFDADSDDQDEYEVHSEAHAEKMDVDTVVPVPAPAVVPASDAVSPTLPDAVPPTAPDAVQPTASQEKEVEPTQTTSDVHVLESVPDATDEPEPVPAQINDGEKESNGDDDMVMGSDDATMPATN